MINTFQVVFKENKMKLTILSILGLIISMPLPANANANANKQLVTEGSTREKQVNIQIEQLDKQASQYIKTYAGNLQSVLKSAIKEGGFTKGIEVCQLVAPTIANQYNQKGWTIGRTSLKLRNESNTPDNWELMQLQHFEQEKAAGADIKQLKTSSILTHDDGTKTYRFMKAIPTQQICLHCHGTQIKPTIQKQLTQLYPQDQATGFTLSDIRGAFTVMKKLN